MDLDIVVCHTNLNIDQSKLIRPVFWLSGFVIWLTWWWMPLFLFLLHPTFYFLLPPSPPCSLSPPLLFLLHPIPLSVVVLSQLGCGLEGSGPSLPSPRLQQQHQPQIQVMQQLWPHPPIDMCISDWPWPLRHWLPFPLTIEDHVNSNRPSYRVISSQKGKFCHLLTFMSFQTHKKSLFFRTQMKIFLIKS